MPSTPWELYEAEAPSPSDVKRALTFIFTAILVIGILVSTFLGA
tara:strand:- start:69 stop:200 length:132 start_codon:yes stop_codon:yes gene_type:complete